MKKINLVLGILLAATLYSCSVQDETPSVAKFNNSAQVNPQIANSADTALSNEIRTFAVMHLAFGEITVFKERMCVWTSMDMAPIV